MNKFRTLSPFFFYLYNRLNLLKIATITNLSNKYQDYQRLNRKETLEPEWLKSKAVRKLLDISAGSVQNLRTSQKVRFKKGLGSYYYNKEDLQKLFDDDKH
jgi:hypothetical protein